MGNVIFIVFAIGCLLFQIVAGYVGNKYLGLILPILLISFTAYLMHSDAWVWRLGDILMPVIGLIALTLIYQGGRVLNPQHANNFH